MPTATITAPAATQSKTSTRLVFWLIVAICLLVVLVVGLLIALYLTKDDAVKVPVVDKIVDQVERGITNSTKTEGSVWQKGCTNEARVNMTHLPMQLNDVGNILPLGLVVGGHVTPIDHLYFSPIIFNSPRDKYPVYAMADGYIVEIGTRRQVTGTGEAKQPEYRIIMQHSCQTISYFDLVTSLDAKILEQVPQLQTKDYAGNLRIPIQGGQQIGRIGGQTLDTAIYNYALELPGFISPELYAAEPWKIHTDDFFSYFPSELAAAMNAKNLRQAEPRSGKIDWDQPGKLIGNWFKEGTNGYAGEQGQTGVQAYWQGHLHIGYDAIMPSNIWVSLGNFNGEAKHFYVKGNKPDPAQVDSTSGLVKYELIQPANFMSLTEVQNYRRREGPVQGVILLQVLAGEKLRVEIFPGKTAAQVTSFTERALIYER